MQNQDSGQLRMASVMLDEGKLFRFHERLRFEQNLPMAIIGGCIAAVVVALLWAIITVTTGFQMAYMAVCVGFFVGYTVRYNGRGMDTVFGIAGIIIVILGCLLGNFFSLIGFVAQEHNLSYLYVFRMIDSYKVPAAFIKTFNPLDILFYSIAIFEGYRFSFRHVTEEEILENAGR